MITAGSQEEGLLRKLSQKALCPPEAKAWHSGAVLFFIHHGPQAPVGRHQTGSTVRLALATPLSREQVEAPWGTMGPVSEASSPELAIAGFSGCTTGFV